MKAEVRGVDIHLEVSFGEDPAEGPKLVQEAVERLARANFNFLRPFVVETRCQAAYDSEFLPVRFCPGWDPLKVIVEEAHARGMEVHPFLCLVSQGGDEPGPVLREHPEWALVDRTGNPIGWGNPAHPEFRKFVAGIAGEVASKYDVDGISLDYTRYPSADIGLSDYDRMAFQEEFGEDPEKASEDALRRWRIGALAQLVREVRDAVKSAKPGYVLSAYVWTVRDPEVCLRDWVAWVREGLLDAVNPTGYRYDYDLYSSWCRESARATREAKDGVPVFINVGVRTSHGALEGPEEVVRWAEGAREVGADGVSFFTLQSLSPWLEEVARKIFPERASLPWR